MRSELQTLHNNVAQSHTQIEELNAAQTAVETFVREQGIDLSTAIGVLDKTVRNTCNLSTNAASQQCEQQTRPVIMTTGNKMVIGEVERVWVDPPGLIVIARIDTGASSSSLHAGNITSFERDGKDWVRFDIGKTHTIERPVKKFVRVFQQADKSGSRRPVIEMRLLLGDVKDTFTFTLADRSHLQHEMILGRNFLTDIALVDVSKQFIQPTYTPAQQ